jgi:hypothetical protein
MIAMKEQFPHLRNGRPRRQKDIDDLELLRGLASRVSCSAAPGFLRRHGWRRGAQGEAAKSIAPRQVPAP